MANRPYPRRVLCPCDCTDSHDNMLPLPTGPQLLALLTIIAAVYTYRYTIRRRGQDVRLLPSPVSIEPNKHTYADSLTSLAWRRIRGDQPPQLAHWLWGHELLAFEGEATEAYTKWAALCGPVFKIKAALFHPEIVRLPCHVTIEKALTWIGNYIRWL